MIKEFVNSILDYWRKYRWIKNKENSTSYYCRATEEVESVSRKRKVL